MTRTLFAVAAAALVFAAVCGTSQAAPIAPLAGAAALNSVSVTQVRWGGHIGAQAHHALGASRAGLMHGGIGRIAARFGGLRSLLARFGGGQGLASLGGGQGLASLGGGQGLAGIGGGQGGFNVNQIMGMARGMGFDPRSMMSQFGD